MSIGSALANAASGLALSARRAELASGNIANAMTPDYARREIAIGSSRTGGVTAGPARTAIDAAGFARQLSAGSDAASASTTASAMTRAAALLSAPDGSNGLPARMTELGNAISQAAADPTDTAGLLAVLEAARSVTGGLRNAADGLQQLRAEADAAISASVETINDSLIKIAELNDRIVVERVAGRSTASLEQSRREQMIVLSSQISIESVPRDHGRIALFTAAGGMLLDGRRTEFAFEGTGMITPSHGLSDGTLGALVVDGHAIAMTSTGLYVGGALEAHFRLRDEILPRIADRLDHVAASLVTRLEAADDTRIAGQGAFISVGGNALDPSWGPGLAGRLSIAVQTDPDAGGNLITLRTGIGGSGSVLAEMSRQFGDPAADLAPTGDPASRDPTGHLAAVNAALQSKTHSAEQMAAARAAIATETGATHAAAVGVDTDRELQTLLTIENAFAANARVLSIVDTMLRELLEI
ncbi:flagellar hook-associated protein FlgK [Roseobacter sp. HKCCA0434]|uniref:flagellar hook-associated protein FlgK n=1 Tax=Roseobacter sp. HKCCA0434 TaxID=3079297 RepID=UPI002905A6F1|nr:flagellar hook-associated protein FlgK [Roseobacter sp. HKCCA0434]